LSNFSANVIRDIQILGFLSNFTTTQQTIDFLSNSWDNMAQNEEIIDSVGNTNQKFQSVVPKKRKNKFKQQLTYSSKGFKVGAFSRELTREKLFLLCLSSSFLFLSFIFYFSFTWGFGFCPSSFCTFLFLLIYVQADDPSARHLLLKKICFHLNEKSWII
jgi:preprotein translocase subunit SecF